MKTLYDLLGVKETATVDEIRAAFRRLAKRFHPDVNKDPQAAEAMKIITHAYEVLTDEKWRRQYDEKLARLRAPKPQQVVRVVMQVNGFGGFNNGTSTNSSTMGGGFTVFEVW